MLGSAPISGTSFPLGSVQNLKNPADVLGCSELPGGEEVCEVRRGTEGRDWLVFPAGSLRQSVAPEAGFTFYSWLKVSLTFRASALF